MLPASAAYHLKSASQESQAERIVERLVEVPVEKIVEVPVEKIVEVPVERVVERVQIIPRTNPLDLATIKKAGELVRDYKERAEIAKQQAEESRKHYNEQLEKTTERTETLLREIEAERAAELAKKKEKPRGTVRIIPKPKLQRQTGSKDLTQEERPKTRFESKAAPPAEKKRWR